MELMESFPYTLANGTTSKVTLNPRAIALNNQVCLASLLSPISDLYVSPPCPKRNFLIGTLVFFLYLSAPSQHIIYSKTSSLL